MCPTFVRTHPNPQPPPQLPETDNSKIRILLVICRPQGGDDVPFRSVATQLIRGLIDTPPMVRVCHSERSDRGVKNLELLRNNFAIAINSNLTN